MLHGRTAPGRGGPRQHAARGVGAAFDLGVTRVKTAWTTAQTHILLGNHRQNRKSQYDLKLCAVALVLSRICSSDSQFKVVATLSLPAVHASMTVAAPGQTGNLCRSVNICKMSCGQQSSSVLFNCFFKAKHLSMPHPIDSACRNLHGALLVYGHGTPARGLKRILKVSSVWCDGCLRDFMSNLYTLL